MKETKLKQLYELLTPAEKEKFGRWLSVEANGKLPHVEALYTELRKKQSKEKIWGKLFPTSPYNDTRFRKISQQLTEYIEEYLAILGFRKNGLLRDRVLVQTLNQRKNPEIFQKTWNKVVARLNKTRTRDAAYFQYQFELELERLSFANVNSKKKTYKESFKQYFSKLSLWIIYEKLNYYLLKAGNDQANLLEIENEIVIISESQKEIKNEPSLEVMLKVYDFITEKREFKPFELIKEIRAAKSFLNHEMYVLLFGTMFNFFIKKANLTGEKRFYLNTLEMYEWGIEDQLLLSNGFLPYPHYKNIIITALKCNLIEKAEKYLKIYEPFLPNSIRDKAVLYCRANYHFYKKEFDETWRILTQRPYIHINDEINGRILCLEARYELGERPELERPLISFLMFLKSNKILSENQKKRFSNRAKILTQLVVASKKERFQEIKETILKTQPLNNQNWLLEKVDKAIATS